MTSDDETKLAGLLVELSFEAPLTLSKLLGRRLDLRSYVRAFLALLTKSRSEISEVGCHRL